MRTMNRAVPSLRFTVRMTRSTTMAIWYWASYFAANRCSTRPWAPGSVSRAATPVSVGAPSGTVPRRLHGRSSTRSVCRSRFTLPLPAGVVTSSASPSAATQTGVRTASPERRKVVSWTKSSAPTVRHVSEEDDGDDGDAGEEDTRGAYPEVDPPNP